MILDNFDEATAEAIKTCPVHFYNIRVKLHNQDEEDRFFNFVGDYYESNGLMVGLHQIIAGFPRPYLTADEMKTETSIYD